MARNDLIVDLIRAGASGDRDKLRATVEALAAEEKAKKNETLAAKLTRALSANGHIDVSRPVSSLQAPGRDLIIEIQPRAQLSELVLTQPVQQAARCIVQEQLRAGLLRSHGLQPRHRVLLSGPPGNGKTILAEAIAEALGVPLFVVRYEALIGSFLGETAQRLGSLFTFARTASCVLFFDEFDVVGKERGDAHETGEIKRVVSNLLLQIDSLPSHVVAIAATNHSSLLDSAVWRRFQLRLEMPKPSRKDLEQFFSQGLSSWRERVGISSKDLVQRLGLLSYAEARDFLLDVRRQHILADGKSSLTDVIEDQAALWAARAKPKSHADRPNKAVAKAGSARPGKAKARKPKQNTVPNKVSKTTAKGSARAEVPTSARRVGSGAGRRKAGK